MIKGLMHDPIFLAGKSEIITKEDLWFAQDLLDTSMAYKETCVGMVANMIGVRKRIIAFLDESGRAPAYTVMPNPEMIRGFIFKIHRHSLHRTRGSTAGFQIQTIGLFFPRHREEQAYCVYHEKERFQEVLRGNERKIGFLRI